MTTELQPATESNSPDVPKPACCPWRTALQVPLLLCAAVGLGFAGQQAWQNRTDFQSLWPNSSACPLSSFINSCCPGSAQSESCGAAALATSCASAAEHTCASSADVLAEVDADETVSALTPENAVEGL